MYALIRPEIIPSADVPLVSTVGEAAGAKLAVLVWVRRLVSGTSPLHDLKGTRMGKQIIRG